MDKDLYHYGIPGMKWGVRKAVSVGKKIASSVGKMMLSSAKTLARKGMEKAKSYISSKMGSKKVSDFTEEKPKSNSNFNDLNDFVERRKKAREEQDRKDAEVMERNRAAASEKIRKKEGVDINSIKFREDVAAEKRREEENEFERRRLIANKQRRNRPEYDRGPIGPSFEIGKTFNGFSKQQVERARAEKAKEDEQERLRELNQEGNPFARRRRMW